MQLSKKYSSQSVLFRCELNKIDFSDLADIGLIYKIKNDVNILFIRSEQGSKINPEEIFISTTLSQIYTASLSR